MTDRPHEFFVRSGDDRRLGSILLADESVFGVEIDPKGLLVRTSDFGRFTKRLPSIAREAGIRVLELTPTDDSLESVFAYLVGR
jgi:ABC-2 type transport system ATP-binding protein